MINIIVAIAQNGVIGGNNTLLWHISEDLRHFKAITSGHPVVMGRKTYESLGRPLPNRHNVVITRSDVEIEGCTVVHSLEEALALFTPKDNIFIIGGAEIYRAAMPIADRFYLTRVHRDYEGDTSYPEWDESEWECCSKEHFERGEKFDSPYTFEEYRRRSNPAREYQITQATKSDSAMIREVAVESFRATYRDFVPADQIEWMTEDMYSVESLEGQFADGHLFFLIYDKGEFVGYVSIERQAERLVHLHKLYLLPKVQGLGYGRVLIEYAFERAKELCGGECRLELDVNRNNKATEFYFKIGLQIASQGDYIIEGTDFVRPDYLLYIELK